jgi:hypothetical protein
MWLLRCLSFIFPPLTALLVLVSYLLSIGGVAWIVLAYTATGSKWDGETDFNRPARSWPWQLREVERESVFSRLLRAFHIHI